MTSHQISLGDLIANIYDRFERRFGDDELTGIATEVTVNDIVSTRMRRGRARAR